MDTQKALNEIFDAMITKSSRGAILNFIDYCHGNNIPVTPDSAVYMESTVKLMESFARIFLKDFIENRAIIIDALTSTDE